MALQFSITAIGTMVLQSAINGLGSTVVGAACDITVAYATPGTPDFILITKNKSNPIFKIEDNIKK